MSSGRWMSFSGEQEFTFLFWRRSKASSCRTRLGLPKGSPPHIAVRPTDPAELYSCSPRNLRVRSTARKAAAFDAPFFVPLHPISFLDAIDHTATVEEWLDQMLWPYDKDRLNVNIGGITSAVKLKISA